MYLPPIYVSMYYLHLQLIPHFNFAFSSKALSFSNNNDVPISSKQCSSPRHYQQRNQASNDSLSRNMMVHGVHLENLPRLFNSATEARYKACSIGDGQLAVSTGDLIFDGICEIETNEWTDGRTDGRVYRIPCLLFCRWVVWRSPEPSWWPIASLVSLICTHR